MNEPLQDFHVRCNANSSGAFEADSDGVSVAVGQRVFRAGNQQIWDFLLVLSKRDSEGVLTTRVLLCHPDWDEPLEIAAVESDSEKMKVQVTGSQPPMG